jgi:DNA polymerase-3 subunit beta
VGSDWFASFELTQKQLRHLFHMVHFAMAQQDIRYYLNGLLLAVDGKTVRVVTTDGHRLAFCATRVEKDLGKLDAILPRKTVLELQRLLEDTEDVVRIDIAANQVRFRFGSVELVSKLIEGKFPDYQRVIPTGYKRMVTLPRETLAAALSRAAILASDKFKGVRFALSPSSLKVQASNSEQEEASDDLDVDYNGESLEIGFNVAYVLDCVTNLKTEQVQLQFGDANSSALLTVPGDDAFKYVVMPMRI